MQVKLIKSLLIPLPLVLIGIFAWTWFLISMAGNNDEIPLSSFQGIAIDSNENIYIGLNCCDRIQVYNKNGKFLRNWKATVSGGKFSLFINKKKHLVIYANRSSALMVYTLNGELLSKKFVISTEIKAVKSKTTLQTNSNVIYSYIHGVVIKTGPSQADTFIQIQNYWFI